MPKIGGGKIKYGRHINPEYSNKPFVSLTILSDREFVSVGANNAFKLRVFVTSVSDETS